MRSWSGAHRRVTEAGLKGVVVDRLDDVGHLGAIDTLELGLLVEAAVRAALHDVVDGDRLINLDTTPVDEDRRCDSVSVELTIERTVGGLVSLQHDTSGACAQGGRAAPGVDALAAIRNVSDLHLSNLQLRSHLYLVHVLERRVDMAAYDCQLPPVSGLPHIEAEDRHRSNSNSILGYLAHHNTHVARAECRTHQRRNLHAVRNMHLRATNSACNVTVILAMNHYHGKLLQIHGITPSTMRGGAGQRRAQAMACACTTIEQAVN